VSSVKLAADPAFPVKVVLTSAAAHAGGAFDPMGFAKDEGDKLRTMKVKELNNGRLAMVAFAGFIAQHEATGKGPIANLGDHLASPASANFATNGISLPSFAFPFLY
jgi:Chlorophyll A-B binding protein